MRLIQICSAVLVGMLCSACGGPVLQERPEVEPSHIDGGFIEYFLPRGELTVTAEYAADSGQLSLLVEPKSVPDFAEKHRIVYTHKGLSRDVVSVELENGLLKSVASTTADQSVQLVQNVNAFLTQVQATKVALEEDHRFVLGEKRTPLTQPDCGENLKKTTVIDITRGEPNRNTTATFATCEIEITLEPHPPNIQPVKALGAQFAAGKSKPYNKEICDEAICFRVAGAYRVDVTACVKKGQKIVTALNSPNKDHPLPVCVRNVAEFLAPTPYRVGVIYFNRRAFVENTTKATFVNGMLTGIESTDPSELIGFLTLPTELLKGFGVLIKL